MMDFVSCRVISLDSQLQTNLKGRIVLFRIMTEHLKKKEKESVLKTLLYNRIIL